VLEAGIARDEAMNHLNYPTGHASAAILKALARALAVEKDAATADAWVLGLRSVCDDLEDETRLVPLSTLHRALAAFAQVCSRDAIPRSWKYLIEPECLGVWVRVLRGTTEPGEAFARLEGSDSAYGRTTRWETTAFRPGRWRGRVNMAHDPSLERDGLLGLVRLAELCAVPALFGYARPAARAVGDTVNPAAGGVAQDYEVTWKVPDPVASAALGSVACATVASLSFLVHTGAAIDASTAAGGAVIGAIGGVMRARELRRRAQVHAQRMRVHALERSLSIKDTGGKDGALEGTVVAGQYRVVRRMGSGATGVVYEAVRIVDGLPIAIKLLRAAAAHEAVASDRLRREAAALGLSWHPNVVEVIDHGHLQDGTSYLAMELLGGESLASRLRTKGRLSPEELLPIALEACDALAAVHAAGVVHRDIKPSNIYLASDRAAPAVAEKVKLLDFGIARVEWEETRITHTGGPLGTPGYMSPEQEAGEPSVDARSDIFALGAVLFECLVGEPPPPATPSGVMRMHAPVASRADSGTQKARAFVPPTWRAVIDKAMALSPDERYPDARSLAQALRRMGDSGVTSGLSS
jgi:serine/threonine-protein kinase